MNWGLILGIIWDLIVYFIGGLFTLGTVIGVFKLLRGWSKYKKEVQLNHSKELVKDFQNIKVTLNEYLKDGLKLEVKSYPTELIEHLKDDAYKDKKTDEMGDKSIIENIKRRDFYINKLHNEELNVFYNGLQDEIINYIKQTFIESDTSRSMKGQINFFNKEIIKIDILRVIANSYPATPESLSFEVRSYDNFCSLFFKLTSNDWIVSDNEYKKELKEIGKQLTTIFDEAINKKFYLFFWYYSKIAEFQTIINGKLNAIIDNIKLEIPLKGKCKKCSKKGGFWRYTWQRIDKYLQ